VGDSVTFFLKNDSILQRLNTNNIGFSDDFEFIPTDSNRILFKDLDVSLNVKNIISEGMQGIAFKIPQIERSVLFLVLLFCLFLFAIIARYQGPSFISTIKNVFSFGGREINIHKQQITSSQVWGKLFLVLQTTLFTSIILFVVMWDYGVSSFPSYIRLLILVGIFIGLSVGLALKLLIYKVTGNSLFEKDVNMWISRYLISLEIMGVIAFIPVLLFIFMPEFRSAIYIIFLILFVLSRLTIITSLLNIFVKYKIGLFYFIVYLCGVEIAPYMILVKVGNLF
jgi:hypothetical protein